MPGRCAVPLCRNQIGGTRIILIMQARAAVGRGQRSTRHASRGCTKIWHVNGEKIHAQRRGGYVQRGYIIGSVG